MPDALDETTQHNLKLTKVDDAPADENQPLGFEDWMRIDLTEQERKDLAKEIIDEIDAILALRSDREKQIRSYRNQYRQILEETSFPFPGAFNVGVPATPDKVDTAMAESQEIFDLVEPRWSIQGPPNKDLTEAIEYQQRVLDSYEDLVSRAATSPKTMFDAWLLGLGWEARVYRRELLDVMERRTWKSKEDFIADFPIEYEKYPEILRDLEQGKEVTRMVEMQEERLRAPVSEHVEWEDAIIPWETKNMEEVSTAQISGRRIWMRYSQIAAMERDGDYIKGTSDILTKKTDLVDGEVRITNKFNPDYKKDPFETFEVRYPVMLKERDGEGNVVNERPVWALVNVSRSHQLTMRVLRYPYHHGRSYMIPYTIQDSEHLLLMQPGLAQKLQQLNLTLDTLASHLLNAGLIGTSLSFKVRSNTDAVMAMYEKQWFPGSVTEMSNPEDAQQWNINVPNMSPLVEFFGIVLSFADTMTGITQTLGGQPDPKNPDAPDVKTARLMRRAMKKLRRYINQLKKSVNESGLQSLRLIQQFIPPKQIAAVIGGTPEEAERLMKPRMPMVVHAAVFDTDRIERQAVDQQWFGLLIKEPLVAQRPSKRVALYRTLARSNSPEWLDKLDELLPTDQELQALENTTGTDGENQQSKIMEAAQRAEQKALEAGKSPEEAAQIKDAFVQKLNQLLAQRAGQPPQPAVEGAQ